MVKATTELYFAPYSYTIKLRKNTHLVMKLLHFLHFCRFFLFLFQAILIAFTSEFIPKLVYKYEHDWNMSGYVNFTLATSPNEGSNKLEDIIFEHSGPENLKKSRPIKNL